MREGEGGTAEGQKRKEEEEETTKKKKNPSMSETILSPPADRIEKSAGRGRAAVVRSARGDE